MKGEAWNSRRGAFLQRVAARPSEGDLSHCEFAVSMLTFSVGTVGVHSEEVRKGKSVEGCTRTVSILETRLDAVGRAETAMALVRAATMVEMRMLGVYSFWSLSGR